MGYAGQELPTQKQPLLLSIQKQQPLGFIPSQKPLKLTTSDKHNTNQKIIDNVPNEQEHSEANIQYSPENSNSYGESQDYSTFNEPQTSPANYPNTKRIIFPKDEGETSLPTFPQTSVPSFIDPSPSS